MTRFGFCRFNGSRLESRPSALSSADWRTTQVFKTITSASSIVSVKVYPRCSRDEPTRCESATFIWHPSVQMWYFILLLAQVSSLHDRERRTSSGSELYQVCRELGFGS